MKTDWDYTDLAIPYLSRPNYSPVAIDAMLKICDLEAGNHVCDVGAGIGHLSLMLADRGLQVTAVEPNDAMRAGGINRSLKFSNISWNEGTGEATGQPSGLFKAVTFGSSFNVCNQQMALSESARILTTGGWFACMWNHRDLTDEVQMEIEGIIKRWVPSFSYGERREDQFAIIEQSNLFQKIVRLDARVDHLQSIEQIVQAWKSHATLKRQANECFENIILEIHEFLKQKSPTIDETHRFKISYNTRIWVAQLTAT